MLVLGVAFPEIDGDSLLSDEKSFDELHSIFEAEGANALNGLVTVVEMPAAEFSSGLGRDSLELWLLL